MKGICCKELQPLSKKPKPGITENITCFILAQISGEKKNIFLVNRIPWLSVDVGKYVSTQIPYILQYTFLCHVIYTDMSQSLSSLFLFRIVTLG